MGVQHLHLNVVQEDFPKIFFVNNEVIDKDDLKGCFNTSPKSRNILINKNFGLLNVEPTNVGH